MNAPASWVAFLSAALLTGAPAQAELPFDESPLAGFQSSVVPNDREADPALLDAAAAEKGRALQTLERIVRIETGTGDAVGLPELADALAGELRALGASVTLHKPADGGVGSNVVGALRGSGGRNLLLIAHMDTVYPRGTLARTPWKVDGNKAYGPGVGDDKSGIAVILHSLRTLQAVGFKGFGTITVLFNTDEEQGSPGSRALIGTLAAASDAVFSYEPTLANPEVMVMNTSGIGAVSVSVKGLAAHAGANPELGVNALIEAADFALRTQDLDAGPGGLRFTWTRLNAGSVNNIVPDQATLYADVRYPAQAALDALTAKLKERAAKTRVPGAEISVTVNPGRPPFNSDAESRALIQRAVDIYDSLGQKIVVIPATGGGTDAGYAMAGGKPIIEALGLPGFGFHANVGEWVRVDAIPRRLYLSAQMIMDVAQRK